MMRGHTSGRRAMRMLAVLIVCSLLATPFHAVAATHPSYRAQIDITEARERCARFEGLGGYKLESGTSPPFIDCTLTLEEQYENDGSVRRHLLKISANYAGSSAEVPDLSTAALWQYATASWLGRVWQVLIESGNLVPGAPISASIGEKTLSGAVEKYRVAVNESWTDSEGMSYSPESKFDRYGISALHRGYIIVISESDRPDNGPGNVQGAERIARQIIDEHVVPAEDQYSVELDIETTPLMAIVKVTRTDQNGKKHDASGKEIRLKIHWTPGDLHAAYNTYELPSETDFLLDLTTPPTGYVKRPVQTPWVYVVPLEYSSPFPASEKELEKATWRTDRQGRVRIPLHRFYAGYPDMYDHQYRIDMKKLAEELRSRVLSATLEAELVVDGDEGSNTTRRVLTLDHIARVTTLRSKEPGRLAAKCMVNNTLFSTALHPDPGAVPLPKNGIMLGPDDTMLVYALDEVSIEWVVPVRADIWVQKGGEPELITIMPDTVDARWWPELMMFVNEASFWLGTASAGVAVFVPEGATKVAGVVVLVLSILGYAGSKLANPLVIEVTETLVLAELDETPTVHLVEGSANVYDWYRQEMIAVPSGHKAVMSTEGAVTSVSVFEKNELDDGQIEWIERESAVDDDVNSEEPMIPETLVLYDGFLLDLPDPPDPWTWANVESLDPESRSTEFSIRSSEEGTELSGSGIVLTDEGSWIETTTTVEVECVGAQYWGDPMSGWARVSVDGSEVWVGNTSAEQESTEDAHFVYLEVCGLTSDAHTLRIENMGIAGEGGGTDVNVLYFGLRQPAAIGPNPTATPAPAEREAALFAYYPFDGDSLDHSGNGHHGENHGGVFAPGVRRQAIHLDGIDDFVQIPVNINPDVMPQMTMLAWVNPDSDKEKAVISHDNGGFDRTIDMDGRGGGYGWSAFSGSAGVLGYHPITVGEWVSLVAVYDQEADSVTLYVNDDVYEGKGMLGAGTEHTLIGANPRFGNHFQGLIDEVMIIGIALTHEQITALREQTSGVTAVEPVEDPVPEPTAHPAETPSETDEEFGDVMGVIDLLRDDEPVFVDDFGTSKKGWLYAPGLGASVNLEEEALQFEVFTPNYMAGNLYHWELSNLLAEVDVRRIAGSLSSGYGLSFRLSDSDNMYIFHIDGNGNYRLHKRVEGEGEDLVDWTYSAAIDLGPGAVNHLGVYMRGSFIVLMINDEVVDVIEDDDLTWGFVGPTVISDDEGDIVVAFDNFILWDWDVVP